MATATAESSTQSNRLSREQLRQVRWAQLAQIADGPDLFLALLVYPNSRHRPCLSPRELSDRLARLAVRLRDIPDRSGRLDEAWRSGLPRLVMERLAGAGLLSSETADMPLLPEGAGLPDKLSDIGNSTGLSGISRPSGSGRRGVDKRSSADRESKKVSEKVVSSPTPPSHQQAVPEGVLTRDPHALLHSVCAHVLVWASHMEAILAQAPVSIIPVSSDALQPIQKPTLADRSLPTVHGIPKDHQSRCNPPALPHPGEQRLWRLYTRDGRYRLLCPDDPDWPGERLVDLYPHPGDDHEEDVTAAPPLCLWVEGDTDLFDGSCLAIVGSRQASGYGLSVTSDCARTAAGAGYAVVTGGAMGVDGQANRAAADLGYPGIAVFAGGLDTMGPARNLTLFSQIVRTGGALVSELPPWVVPRSYRFLERNRLIAALSDAVLVTQARFRSGALNTAGWARRIGRPVIVVPGPITDPASGGCNTQLRLPPETRPDVLTRVDMLPALIEEGMTAVQLEQSRLRRAHAQTRVIGSGVPASVSGPTIPDPVASHPSGTGHLSGTGSVSDTDRPPSPRRASITAHPSEDDQRPGTRHEDSLTRAMIDLLRPRRQNASQLYAALLPHHPGLSVGQVLARLSWLEEERCVSIDEAGRASLIEDE